jgi:hypothetical protein
VDALKRACPGYAVMRSLVMSFRTILRTGKIKTLHAVHELPRAARPLKDNKENRHSLNQLNFALNRVLPHCGGCRLICRHRGQLSFASLGAVTVALSQMAWRSG